MFFNLEYKNDFFSLQSRGEKHISCKSVTTCIDPRTNALKLIDSWMVSPKHISWTFWRFSAWMSQISSYLLKNLISNMTPCLSQDACLGMRRNQNFVTYVFRISLFYTFCFAFTFLIFVLFGFLCLVLSLQTHLYNTDRAKEFFDGIFCDSGRKIGHKHLICLVFFSCKKIKSIIKKSVLL